MTHSEQEQRLDRLYALLPTVHRLQDGARGQPLRALLQVLASQLNLIEDDIAQLYDNWFIETCADWVVPYIGDLVAFRPVEQPPARAAQTKQLRVVASRREVANTIRSRRRKGTLAVLEQLALDVAGWPARAVEFSEQLMLTPGLDYPDTWRRATLDLRALDTLDRLGGPFDTSARTVDVRRRGGSLQAGTPNLPSVGLFVFRLQSFSVTRTPACCLEQAGPHCYTFSALGNDSPLFAPAQPESSDSDITKQQNVPHAITRNALERSLKAPSSLPSYYGADSQGRAPDGFAIWAEDWPRKGQNSQLPLATKHIAVADLSDFAYTPARDQVAVDPVLGRIAFPSKQLPKKGVWVSYHYAASTALGGGEYARPQHTADEAQVIRVEGHEQLRQALLPWQTRRHDDSHNDAAHELPAHAVIEIADSGVYVLPFVLTLPRDHSLTLRAAPGTRPVVRLLDWQTDRPDSLTVTGAPGSHFTLEGLMIAGRGLRIEGELSALTIRHSTLVPGWTLAPDCEPQRPAEPSIELINSQTCLLIEHSVVGSIQIELDEVDVDPVRVRIYDSIVDATGSNCDRPECEAIGAAGSERAHATLEIVRSTVIGRVHAHAIELAEDSIFTGCISVARRQVGCMRFCSVCHCSRTPRRFQCQPDHAEQKKLEALQAEHAGVAPDRSDPAVEAALEQERLRVRPRFDSLRYGTPSYARLAQDCAPEILRGAESGSEPGAFHDLFHPQRLASLTVRLDEYVPAATDASVIFAT